MIGAAPGFTDALLAANERALWPIVVAVVIFAVAGAWVARRERTTGADARGPNADHDADRDTTQPPNDTRAE